MSDKVLPSAVQVAAEGYIELEYRLNKLAKRVAEYERTLIDLVGATLFRSMTLDVAAPDGTMYRITIDSTKRQVTYRPADGGDGMYQAFIEGDGQ